MGALPRSTSAGGTLNTGLMALCPHPRSPGVHALLRKLQFLFELPSRLTKCVELGAYRQAVHYQGRARAVLQQYQHLPSFRAIQDDCQVIMARLAQQLRQRFRYGPSVPTPGYQAVGSCCLTFLSSLTPQGGRLWSPRAG